MITRLLIALDLKFLGRRGTLSKSGTDVCTLCWVQKVLLTYKKAQFLIDFILLIVHLLFHSLSSYNRSLYVKHLLLRICCRCSCSPAAQAIDFSSIAAGPAPSLTGPPVGANTQDITYNSASVSAAGSAKATTVESASATASQAANSRRWFPWGWVIPTPITTYTITKGSGGYPTTAPSYPTTPSYPVTTPYSQYQTYNPSTTSPASTSISQTTSAESACPTVPEARTYCGFINTEDPCAPQPNGTPFLRSILGAF